MSCAFCENIEIQERVIYKDSLVWVFPTNIPIVPGHLLVCPVRHVAKIDDLTNEEFLAIKDLILKLKSSLSKVFGAEGFNFAWNEGKMAGQSVPHMHVHLLPRKTGDSGIYEYEPRKFLYRPGEREASRTEELKQVAELVKEKMQ